jgi:electron transfer flavoprotein beta subunit
MNIIVFAKQIRHTYARTGRTPDAYYICPEDSVYRVNPHDEAAMELALRLKDAEPSTSITLITLGPMIAEAALRKCMATGADELYQITVSEQSTEGEALLDQPDPWIKSGLMARAVRELQADLVLCGKESIDKGNGQVGALLANRLDQPFVSAITDVSLNKQSGVLQAQRSAGRGVREIIECALPAVCSVDVGVELRLPKFVKRQWADAYPLKQLNYGADPDAPKLVCTHRFQPRPRPKLVTAPDSRLHAYERIMQLLTGSKVEKKGEMLTGSPESQVEGIIAFLKDNGFLESSSADE